jgi:hypothetical protein
MLKMIHRFITLCSVLALAFGLVPARAYAADNNSDQERPVRLYATALAGPIGKIEGVSSSIINGRAVEGERAIWDGELLQAPVGRHLRVALDDVGVVTLQGGAIARLAVTRRRFDDNVGGAVLVAALIKGRVAVKLRADAEAYIEASGSAVSAARGSDFLLGLDENGPALLTTAGNVAMQGQVTRQGNYLIRPAGGRANIDVRLRKSRQVQFIVTDEHDKPVPDVPVVIAISGGGATLGSGAATVTVTTSASGLATTSVSAGTAVGSSTITASVPGGASASMGVSAVPAGIITGTTLAIAAAVAAAGTTAAVVAVNKGGSSDIKESSGPRITPIP